MYIYMYTYTYIFIYTYTYKYIYTYACVCLYHASQAGQRTQTHSTRQARNNRSPKITYRPSSTTQSTSGI